MRIPMSWLRDYVALPVHTTGRDVAARLVRAGLEVETVDLLNADLAGPLVAGTVLRIEELEGFKRSIRRCEVDVGQGLKPIVCGAQNFEVGDVVVVALPGARLPGADPISTRTTYGKASEGMICSAGELGMSDNHDGVLVLPPQIEPGTDAIALLELIDEVLDIAVTPDRGYCQSLRGVARETATSYGLPLRDPASITNPVLYHDGHGPQVEVEDVLDCSRFTARTVTGLDPTAVSPIWLQRRIQKAGMRPVSLVVDITNYVMLELGQPLHVYDRNQLAGTIQVRRARHGETLRTLDGVTRTLTPEDLLVCDDSGPLGLAGVMGGTTAEVTTASAHTNDGRPAVTTDVVIEAAQFHPARIARTARRHKLPSEAAKRFERGVDPEITIAATQRVADLLGQLAAGVTGSGITDVQAPRPGRRIVIPADHADRVAGRVYGRSIVKRRLRDVGCTVTGDTTLEVLPPSWRPDLSDPNDLAEEIIRLEGYEVVPAILPKSPPGRGLTPVQRRLRRMGRALAAAGYVEVLNFPFLGPSILDRLGLAPDDPRRSMVKLANPLSEQEPFLRATLLPGLLSALRRNIGRGITDLALFEAGSVYRIDGTSSTLFRAPTLSVQHRPSSEEQAALDASLPRQPRHLAAVLTDPHTDGRGGDGHLHGWAEAIESARTAAQAVGVDLDVRPGDQAPWHPGRCARLLAGGRLIGHAGELHPGVIKNLQLPPRICAMELDLDALVVDGVRHVTGPRLSTMPLVTQDIEMVVGSKTPAADVEEALRTGAGPLLEKIQLSASDVRPGADSKTLVYTLSFRAPDRHVTAAEMMAARNAAVAEATRRNSSGENFPSA